MVDQTEHRTEQLEAARRWPLWILALTFFAASAWAAKGLLLPSETQGIEAVGGLAGMLISLAALGSWYGEGRLLTFRMLVVVVVAVALCCWLLLPTVH